MAEIADHLLFRLSDKGVLPSHVPGLVRDVQNILNDGRPFTVGIVNHRLEGLGWGEDILDELIFQLILSVTERTVISKH